MPLIAKKLYYPDACLYISVSISCEFSISNLLWISHFHFTFQEFFRILCPLVSIFRYIYYVKVQKRLNHLMATKQPFIRIRLTYRVLSWLQGLCSRKLADSFEKGPDFVPSSTEFLLSALSFFLLCLLVEVSWMFTYCCPVGVVTIVLPHGHAFIGMHP